MSVQRFADARPVWKALFARRKMYSGLTLDTSSTLAYNIWPRSLPTVSPGTTGPSARAHNHHERSVNISGSTTQTQGLQRAAQSPAQPRCPEAFASRCLSAMSRDAIAPSSLPLVRHLSRHPGSRGQGQEKEILIDRSLTKGTLFRPCWSGFACTALVVSR